MLVMTTVPAKQSIFTKGSSSMFGKKQESPHDDMQNMVAQVNNAILRLRVIEERNQRLNERLQLTDQSALRMNKRLSEEIKIANEDITELKLEVAEIKEKIMLIIKELRSSPKKEEFEILRKYIEMWEPLNFVTHKEVENIVEDQLRRKQESI